MGAAYLKVPPAPPIRSDFWCDGKAKFESAVLAQTVVKRKPHETRKIYRCRTCGAWHLGQSTRENIVTSKEAKSKLVRSK